MSGIIGIAGVGMIGGSIGLRARHNGGRVIGYDRDGATCARALELGAIDEAVTFEALVERSDMLVLAAHVDATLDLLRRLAEAEARAELIVDVGSVKVPMVEAARGLRTFVATHPMAGLERSGVDAARADVFEGRTWAFVPSESVTLNARARAFISTMGARPIAVDAQEHDRIVALTSHLPQVVAWCFGRALGERSETVDALCGPVARELLRLGGSSEAMWTDILRANAPNVERELRALARALDGEADTLVAPVR